MLIDLSGDDGSRLREDGWPARVDYIPVAGPVAGAPPPGDTAPAAALLIRPDGYVAWAAAPDDLDR